MNKIKDIKELVTSAYHALNHVRDNSTLSTYAEEGIDQAIDDISEALNQLTEIEELATDIKYSSLAIESVQKKLDEINDKICSYL